MGLFGIVFGLILLGVLAYKGMSILWLAPLCGLVVAALNGLNLLDAFMNNFMPSLGGYVISWFPMFMIGAIFGKIMDVTGAAESIAVFLAKLIGAKRCMIAIPLISGVLTYGGVSLFVVVFVVYPMALALFREANFPRRLLPGPLAIGSFTFTMTAIPGTPQSQNVIPTRYFDVSPTSGPIIGLTCGILMFVLGVLWMTYRMNKAVSAGEVFDEPSGVSREVKDASELPKWYISIIPPLCVILIFNVARLDIVVSLVIGCIVAIALFIKRLGGFNNIVSTINAGAESSMLAILNTSSGVGFGGVVRATPAWDVLTALITSFTFSPLIVVAVGSNLLAGAAGSASGGVSILLEALGPQFVQMSESSGISLGVFARIMALASGGLDTLPHNGAVLTLLAVTQMTHKKSYIDICMTSVIIPIVTTIIGVIMGSIGIQ